MSSVPSWVWPAAGWVLLVCGGYLLLLGRVRLLKRRGRLCRGCWYDMAGLESLQCPECGRVAKSERELLRRRSGAPERAVGAVLVVASVIAPRLPEIRSNGWVGGVPDWVLAIIAPREDPWVGWLGQPGAYSQPTPVVGTTYEKVSRALLAEAGRRLNDGEMSGGAALYYLRRVHSETLGYVDTNMLTPSYWPRGEGMVPAWFSLQVSQGGYGLGGFTVMTPAVDQVDEKANRVRVALLVSRSQRSYEVGTRDRRVDFSFGASELMEPLQSPELDAQVAALVQPTIALQPSGGELLVFGTTDSRTLPCFGAYECTLLLDGKPMLRKSFSFFPSGSPTAFANRVELTPAQIARIETQPGSVEVVLCGKPGDAIALYRTGWRFDTSRERPKAWAGTVRVKPAVVRYTDPGSTAKPPVNLVEPAR